MGKFRDLANRLKAATEEAQTRALAKIVKNNQTTAVDLNIDQMLHGKNNEGQILGDYARPEYKELKIKMNPVAEGHVDLRLTGDFQAGMYLEGDEFPFNINSTDLKTGKLGDGYDGIFGLDDKSKKEFLEQCAPEIREYYQSLFKL